MQPTAVNCQDNNRDKTTVIILGRNISSKMLLLYDMSLSVAPCKQLLREDRLLIVNFPTYIFYPAQNAFF